MVSDMGSLVGSNSSGGIASAWDSLCNTTPAFVCCLIYSTAVPVKTNTPPSGAATTLYASDGSPTVSHTFVCFLLSILIERAVIDVEEADPRPSGPSWRQSSVGSLVPWRNTASRTSRKNPRLST